MNPLAFGIDLGKVAREEKGAVEAGVECAETVNVVVLYGNAAKHLVPPVPAGGLHVVEGLAVEFTEIEFGLLGADEG